MSTSAVNRFENNSFCTTTANGNGTNAPVSDSRSIRDCESIITCSTLNEASHSTFMFETISNNSLTLTSSQPNYISNGSNTINGFEFATHEQTSIKPNIIIKSPVGYQPAIYEWPLSSADEIIDTIKWVAKEHSHFKLAIEKLLEEQTVRNYDDVKCLCDKFNKLTENVITSNNGDSDYCFQPSWASRGLLRHIMYQVYNNAVVDPEKLNQYPPFSSEVYGETSFDFVAQMIDDDRTKPGLQDTFIDLGSGVGQVVMQMAGSVDCKKCFGIEKAKIPAMYAKNMEDKFRFWMNWHGKKYSEFDVYHGDFFEDRFKNIIKESTHIFVNNYAFKPEVDHKLKSIFSDLKDGAVIVSSKQFCQPNIRVTERNLTDIGSMMTVVEMMPLQKKGSVSWTDKCLPYYLHILDSTKIEKYYQEQMKQMQHRSSKKSKRSSSPKDAEKLKSVMKEKKVTQTVAKLNQTHQNPVPSMQNSILKIVITGEGAIKLKIFNAGVPQKAE